jgi:hypothetical protein
VIGTERPYLCCSLFEAEELLWLRSGETAHRVAAAVAHDGRTGQRPWANSCSSALAGIPDNQIRPWALGRSNWLFAGSLRSGKRAAVIMSLIQSARMNGHDPYAYLKDVLTRLPIQRASEIDQLLPHKWQPV